MTCDVIHVLAALAGHLGTGRDDLGTRTLAEEDSRVWRPDSIISLGEQSHRPRPEEIVAIP